MAAGLARVVAARDRFVEVARGLGPDAPTLCEGWTVRDIVAHLLVLQRDPLAWPGVAVPGLAGLTTRRMAAQTAAGFTAALDTLAAHSPRIPAMVDDLPGGPMLHHLGEYVVHTEDLARPNRVPGTLVDAEVADALWRRAQVVAALLRRRRGRGLVLVRTDTAASAAILRGPDAVVAAGTPLELLMWAHRGSGAADVTLTDAATGAPASDTR